MRKIAILTLFLILIVIAFYNSCKKDDKPKVRGKWNIKFVSVNDLDYAKYLDTVHFEYYVFDVTDNETPVFSFLDSTNSSDYYAGGRWGIGKHDSNTNYLSLFNESIYDIEPKNIDSNNFLPSIITGDESWIILELTYQELKLKYTLDTNTYKVTLVRR